MLCVTIQEYPPGQSGTWYLCKPALTYYYYSDCTRYIKQVVKHSSKYNQQDAMLYNILYYCQRSTCFRWFLHLSGAENCIHSIWYMSSLLAATASGVASGAIPLLLLYAFMVCTGTTLLCVLLLIHNLSHKKKYENKLLKEHKTKNERV